MDLSKAFKNPSQIIDVATSSMYLIAAMITPLAALAGLYIAKDFIPDNSPLAWLKGNKPASQGFRMW